MSNYRRLFISGGIYFFTVVTHKRQHILCDKPILDRLKASFRYVKNKHPFKMTGLVILPDHLHCIWQPPENDHNFSLRWSMLKRYFSMGLEVPINARKEKNIWQRRFWERYIRDEEELHRCLDYIHFNPVKHGYVMKPCDWKHSTFLKHVELGHYDLHWGANGVPKTVEELSWE
ncbi:MAG: REP-associated tyrosine transposase [Gammaproteobacteria bacterium]